RSLPPCAGRLLGSSCRAGGTAGAAGACGAGASGADAPGVVADDRSSTGVRMTTGGIGLEPGMLILIRVVSVVSVLGTSGFGAGAGSAASGASCASCGGCSDG
ncbi:MAG TPA: hypothetical protein DEQ61_09265, partial [Streptomyces sp.]|nr:hypothetical protein [Streptomyces sp.]